MRKFKILSLALAAVAFVGLYACNSSTNEAKEVETEVVVEEETQVVDSAIVESEVIDSTAVEATEAEPVEEAEPAAEN